MLAKYTLLFLLASSLSVTAVFTPYISQIHPNGDKKMCIQPGGSGSAADVISAPCRRSREQLWLVGANSRCQNLKNGGCLNAGGQTKPCQDNYKPQILSFNKKGATLAELLREILGQVIHQDLPSCLFVCKSWSNEVLNIQWRDIYSPEELFRLLVPMKRQSDGRLYFIDTLERADWSRFFRYSCRVKLLSLEDARDVSPEAYAAIRRYRPTDKVLLPNMTVFSSPCDPDIFDLFSHSNVTSLRITNSSDDFEPIENIHRIQTLFSDLPTKVPHLENWATEIIYKGDFEPAHKTLAQTIASFPNLKTLSINPEWATPRVTDVIITHPHLHILHAYNEWVDSEEISRPPPVFSKPLGSEHFRSLKELEITMGFEQAIRCFGPARCILDKVTAFKINSKYYETTETYGRMVGLLPRVFPSVSELTVEANSDLVPDNMLESRITLNDHLQPILSLPRLTVLALCHSMPFQLLGKDLKLIVSTLKHIKRLNLNCQPAISSSTSLHLSSLSDICFDGCSLLSIQLYVDLSPLSFPEYYHQDDRRLHPELCLLFIGAEDLLLSDIPAVSQYLSYILPYGFDLEAGFHSTLQWEKEDMFATLQDATVALLDALHP
ncbi:hypothetical protein ONZ45_g10392 [Pleurotus djamor]|nr:hypothetical protein ONZ45_g10392 [Pleurotus djamor]